METFIAFVEDKVICDKHHGLHTLMVFLGHFLFLKVTFLNGMITFQARNKCFPEEYSCMMRLVFILKQSQKTNIGGKWSATKIKRSAYAHYARLIQGHPHIICQKVAFRL